MIVERTSVATWQAGSTRTARDTRAWEDPQRPLPRVRDRLEIDHIADYCRGAKRVLDVIVSLGALTAFAAALPVVALAIKAESRGPVFFRQARVGVERRRQVVPRDGLRERRRVSQPGRPFHMIKLRTMGVDAEAGGPQLATRDDARITRVGRFLRQSRLDEFPQFVNVLRGEMSVVGPRPERLCFVRRLEGTVPRYRDRLVVLPGITGLAQVVNGYDTDLDSVRRKVALDGAYIDSLSLRNDLRIIGRTFGVMINGRGAL